MSTLTVKNIPDDLYNELKQVAARHQRSINSEVIVCLKRILQPVPSHMSSNQDKLRHIQALRAEIPANLISVEEIDQAISEGRS